MGKGEAKAEGLETDAENDRKWQAVEGEGIIAVWSGVRTGASRGNREGSLTCHAVRPGKGEVDEKEIDEPEMAWTK